MGCSGDRTRFVVIKGKKTLVTLVALRSLSVSFLSGALAQLVERLNGIEKVSGSNPLCSTTLEKKSGGECLQPSRSLMGVPLRTSITGRPVGVWYSFFGSMPSDW